MNVEQRTIAVILSTMRSGSTLLKALLAEADDISNLPEVNFQRFQTDQARCEIEQLSDAPIIVLKRPAWYNETRSYPKLPCIDGLKEILLVRDAYETVSSLKKMTFRRFHILAGPCNRLLLTYWCRIVGALLLRSTGANTQLVRYEELIARPVEVTAQLFQFLGSTTAAGVERYGRPVGYDWRWGRDDGGPRIGELRVLPPKPHQFEDQRLARMVRDSQTTGQLRRRLGYPELPV